MRLFKALALAVVLAPALATLQAKPKKPQKLSAQFRNAQYVYVEAVDGQQFDPRLNPEDLRAIGDVQEALGDWHRYVLTMRREDAELIFVVRKGRVASARVGVEAQSAPEDVHVRIGGGQGKNSTGTGNGAPTSAGPAYTRSVGGEAGPADDLLEVYEPTPKHPRGILLWQHTLAEGLDEPDLPLFQQLKEEVDRTYPVRPASQAKKP